MIDTKHENSVASMTPEFYLIGILQSLIDNKHEDMLRDYRLRIFTALKQLDHETLWWEMVRGGLEFLALNGRCPQSVEEFQPPAHHLPPQRLVVQLFERRKD